MAPILGDIRETGADKTIIWVIIKPLRFDPTDPDYLCVFQDPARYKQATVRIPTA